MKQYLYVIVFILSCFVFSGCFNERRISSSDNQTEDSVVVSKNHKKVTDNSSHISKNISSGNNSASAQKSINLNSKTTDNISFINKTALSSSINNSADKYKPNNKKTILKGGLTGTYKIIFFGSQVIKVDSVLLGNVVDMYYISNDCKKAQQLYPAIVNNGIKNQCNLLTQSKILDGMVTIFYDSNDNVNIVSRLQLEGGVVDNSPEDKYQYTVYAPITDTILLKGEDVTNWNYNTVEKAPAHFSKLYKGSSFQLTILDNDLIRIDMTLLNKKIKAIGKNIMIDAKNTIIIKKISSDYTELENKVQKTFNRK